MASELPKYDVQLMTEMIERDKKEVYNTVVYKEEGRGWLHCYWIFREPKLFWGAYPTTTTIIVAPAPPNCFA